MESTIKNAHAPRREFLGALATGAALLGMSAIPGPLKAEESQKFIRGDYGSADEWFNKVKGKHRIVFDATNHHQGFPLAWAAVYLNTNNKTGTPDKDLNAIVILRHDAIPVAMEDAMWKKYMFGDVFKIEDKKTGTPAVRNIYYKVGEGELPLPGMALDDLQKRGVMFGVCDMALTVYSHVIGQQMNLNPDDVKKDWLGSLIPDIQVLPSGVWAVNRAQEHGCSYCFAG